MSPVVFTIHEAAHALAVPSRFLSSAPAATDWIAPALWAVWASGFLAIVLMRFRQWKHINAAVHSSFPFEMTEWEAPAGIRMRFCRGLREPAVVGFTRRGSVLLFPEELVERLTPAQVETVVAHERCHIGRRDNLLAAFHMLVEALFWFHPVVWWIGARLFEERERACDQDVLLTTGQPQAYAESILSVCRMCLESPLACVSGISGANLKQRIADIVNNHVGQKLSGAKKAMIASTGVAALAIPILIGIANAPPIQAQSAGSAPAHFDVASVKLSRDPAPGGNVEISPGRFRGTDLALQWLILVAYGIKSGNLTGNLPRWTIDERYTIDARTESSVSEDRIPGALRELLKKRFGLKEHREMRQEAVYFLTVGKTGNRMPAGSCVSQKKDYPNECWAQGREGLVRTLDWRGTSISNTSEPAYRTLAGQLALILGRTVIDKTGLTGTFDVHLRWSSDPPPPAEGAGDASGLAIQVDPTAPQISEALDRQLGLKLESGRGPVEYMVVDEVQRPAPN